MARFALSLVALAALAGLALHAHLSLTVFEHRAAILPAEPAVVRERALGEIVAAFHLHTGASWDGAGDVADLIAAARENAVDAVFLTEHNNTTAWASGGRGPQGVVVVPGLEASTESGHYVLVGIEPGAWDDLSALYRGKPPLPILDSLLMAQGGEGYVAHPRGDRRPWEGPIPPSARGIEIANVATEWRDERWWELLRALVFYPFDPGRAVLSLCDAPRAGLALWDSLLATRDLAGVAAQDSHGGLRVSERARVRFPSHGAVLPTVHQHLWVARAGPGATWTRDPVAAARDALAAGRSFAAYDGFASARGAAFWIECDGASALPGERLALRGHAVLRGELPSGVDATARVLRDGAVVAEMRDATFAHWITEPGTYRVEVLLRRRSPWGGEVSLPWIYANAIRVTSGSP